MKSDCLFMNISSDQVIISDGEMNILLERNDIEATLGPKLVQLIHKWNYTKIIVLNWPGWFTNLRVGTLCMNILNSVMNNQLSFYSISKVDLYKKAFENGILPETWIIYIWQKRNIWLWNCKKWEKIWQYSFDELKDLNLIDFPIFLDEVVDENYYPDWLNEYMNVKISFDWNNLTIDNNNKIITFSIGELGLESLKSVAPNYMMDPSITLTHK